MGSLRETNPSLWVGTTPDALPYAAPATSARFDVVVVGAGIAGLTTARLLARDGCSVAVLEAGRVSSGVTGYTTAKITALQRTTISEIASRLGKERAAAYAAANAAAVDHVARLVSSDGIECGFERAPACTYTTEPAQVDAINDEHDAATAAGLATRLDVTTELPFDVVAALWLDDQAQFHPRQYCLGLAQAIVGAGGSVFERARVLDVTEDDSACVVTVEGDLSITADQVVIASHLPFLDAGGYFARAHAYRSYALAARVHGERVRGMYISAESPTRSIRSTSDGWTVLGGEGHKVGQDDDTRQRYAALERWANDTFPVDEVGYRWSAQDYESVDGMPYIGRINGRERTWTATGFRKWGMSNGTVAGMIISDLIAGRANAWAEAFDATRIAPGASIKSLVKENVDVGKRFIADRIKTWRPKPASELAAGEGAVVELDGEAVAAFRDDDGTLHAVAATCTHMGCRVTFNTAERSWDCPCHGSRFGVDGRVLQGPAVEDLAPKTAG